MEADTSFSVSASSSSSMFGVSVPTPVPSLCFGASSPISFSFGFSSGSGQTGSVIGSTSSSPSASHSSSFFVPGAYTGSFGSLSGPSTNIVGSSTPAPIFGSGRVLFGSSTAPSLGIGSAPATGFSLPSSSPSSLNSKASLAKLISGNSKKGKRKNRRSKTAYFLTSRPSNSLTLPIWEKNEKWKRKKEKVETPSFWKPPVLPFYTSGISNLKSPMSPTTTKSTRSSSLEFTVGPTTLLQSSATLASSISAMAFSTPTPSALFSKVTTSIATSASSSSGNTSSLLLTLKSSTTDGLPSLGSDEVRNINEPESEGVKMLTCLISEGSFVEGEEPALDVVKENQVAIVNNVYCVESGLSCSVTPSTNIVVKEMTTNPSQVHDSHVKACSLEETFEVLESEATQVLKKQKMTEVVDEDSDHPVSNSEVCGTSGDSKQSNLILQNTLSAGTSYIIKQILHKYGDITAGSILKTEEVKTAFLQLVAKVVEKLKSHTLDTLTDHEMQMIQKLTNDTASVGFHVEWLQQRIQKIVKYQKWLMQLSDIDERIDAAKKALSEIELQQVDLNKKLDFMNAETDMYKFCKSNLCVGLF